MWFCCIFYFFCMKRCSVSIQYNVRFFNPNVAYSDSFSQACGIKVLWRFFLSSLQGWLERSKKEGEEETKGSKQEMKHKSGLEKDWEGEWLPHWLRMKGWHVEVDEWMIEESRERGHNERWRKIIERSRPKMVLLQSHSTFNFLSFPLASLPVF